MNSVNLTRNLTRDPESRETKGGTRVCTLRLAVSGCGHDADPIYVDVVAFDRQAEGCDEYLKKGRAVAVLGRSATPGARPRASSAPSAAVARAGRR